MEQFHVDLQELQAKNEWTEKNILKFCPQVLFLTSACGAICSTISYKAQVGEALPTEPLGALSVVVLYQPACLVSISLGAYQLSISSCSDDTKML